MIVDIIRRMIIMTTRDKNDDGDDDNDNNSNNEDKNSSNKNNNNDNKNSIKRLKSKCFRISGGRERDDYTVC